MNERRAYHPIEANEASHLIGKDIVCGNTREGLGYWAKLMRIDIQAKKPYVCELDYRKAIKNFKWVATKLIKW